MLTHCLKQCNHGLENICSEPEKRAAIPLMFLGKIIINIGRIGWFFTFKPPLSLSLSQCFLEMFRKMKLILVGYFVRQISRISFLIIFFLYYLLHNIVETTVLKVCNPLV